MSCLSLEGDQMLKGVSPQAKTRIAAAWAQAITGNTAGALSLLAGVTGDPSDSVAAAMTRAHLLYLDGKNLEALTVFDTDIQPMSRHLTQEITYVIGTNRNTLRLALNDFTAIRDHYKMQDVERQSHREEESLKRLIQADEAAARNEHRQALPLYWSNLLDAYQDGTWARLRAAHQRLARECWALGWFSEAVFHAVASLNKDTVTFIATQALASRSLNVITETLRPVLRTASLLEHRSVAAIVIQILHDVIPETMFAESVTWLKTGIDTSVETEHVAERLSSLWRAIAAIAHRFSSEQANTIVTKALTNPAYTKYLLQRRYVIDVLHKSFAKLDSDTMMKVAESCIGLLGSQKHDIDYDHARNLAATIADKGPPSIAALLADAILPRDTSIADLRLAILVPFLDRKPAPDRLATIVSAVPAKIRRQVQRLNDKEEADANLSYMAMMKESKDGRTVVVFLYGAAIELDAVIAMKRWLTQEQIRSIAEATLDMVHERANIPANKVNLLKALVQLADSTDIHTSQLIFERLEPLLLTETIVTEVANPLSPFQMNLGTNQEVSGWLLYCAGRFAAKHSSLLGAAIIPHLERGLTSAYQEVRSASVSVIGELPSASSSLISQLISSASDSSTVVATSAFVALVRRSSLALNKTQWQFLASAVRLGLTHTSSGLRRAAADAVRCLKKVPLTREQIKTIGELTTTIQADISFVVRESLQMESERAISNSPPDPQSSIVDLDAEPN
jgi:hypothetical protein